MGRKVSVESFVRLCGKVTKTDNTHAIATGNSSSLAVASVSWGVERRSGYAEVQVVSGGCGDGGGSGHASNDARDAMRFQFGVVRCSADGTYPEQEQLPSQVRG